MRVQPDPHGIVWDEQSSDGIRYGRNVGTLTLVEAAALIGVQPATLRQQIANGKLRATKHGRDWWVTRGEVERYRRDSRR